MSGHQCHVNKDGYAISFVAMFVYEATSSGDNRDFQVVVTNLNWFSADSPGYIKVEQIE